ncbi:MAG: hypothetical protein Q4F67_00800 [Propionibacteriaceae bacterium]|nr:hypothetical protein [Propionibacteriaceae bacterium]
MSRTEASPLEPLHAVTLPWRTGLALSLIVTAFLVLSELDRLSGQLPATDGTIHSLGELVGPRTSNAAWVAVLNDPTGVMGRLLGAHLVADTLLVLTYAWLGLALARRTPPWSRVGTALLVTGLVDLTENLLIAAASRAHGLVPLVVVVTLLKWAGIAVTVVIAAMAVQRTRPLVRAWLGMARFALRIQRFSLLVLAVLVGLSLVPRDGVFDQLPDIQRSWPESARGLGQFAAAVGVLVVMSVAAFVLGRLRSQHLFDERARGPVARPPYPLAFWLIAPAVAWLLALANPRDVLWGRLITVTVVIVALAAISFALRCAHQPAWLEDTRPLDRTRIDAAAATGDLVAVGLIAASGAGLVRAFIGPLVLGLVPAVATAFTVLGIVAAIASWPAAAWLIHRLDRLDAPAGPWWYRLLTPGVDWQRPRGLVSVLSIAGGLGLLTVAIWPGIAGAVGVSATVLLAAGLIALFVGGLVVLGQDLRPPEALDRLGFRTTPVALLLIGLLLLANLSPASTRIHGLRTLPGELPERPSLSQAFETWLRTTDGCGRDLGGGLRWRPLLLYAAEGGGVRAAYWTASAIDAIAATDADCAQAFLSGGASGGAVGLTVAQVSEPGEAGHAVTALSRSDALARASLGMFVRDVLRAGTGLPLTTPGQDPQWQDRAALIERAWEQTVPALNAAYLDPRQPGPPGNLILNTTAVSSGCRTYLSQLALPSGAATPPAAGDCDGDRTPGGRSVDFFAHDAAARCVGPLRASTAALTASRFPYVTPAAAVGCPGQELDQLVDGGYVENTGLGTLVDLWPEVSALVREHNDRALAGTGSDLVVPMVVFLTNSPGTDLAPPGRPITEELLVPPVAFLRAGGAQASPSALLQRLRGTASAGLWSGTPQEPALDRLPQRRVFVVYPATRPALTAPLGWTLSGMSRASMDQALAQQRQARCGRGLRAQDAARRVDRASAELVCERGYGVLGDLVGELR